MAGGRLLFVVLISLVLALASSHELTGAHRLCTTSEYSHLDLPSDTELDHLGEEAMVDESFGFGGMMTSGLTSARPASPAISCSHGQC